MEDTSLISSRAGDWLVRRAGRGETSVRAQLGRQRLVYLLGPEANALVFAHDEWFRVREAFAALEVVDGPTSVVLSDGPDHARRRGLIRPSLAPRRIDGYVESMVASADEALDTVTPGEVFDAYALMRSAIRRSTLRALFGADMGERADEIGETLQPLLDMADHLPQTIDWLRRLRTPSWRRALTARAAVDDFIFAEIARERAGRPGDDPGAGPVLPMLVHGRDGTGSGLTDQEVRDQAVTMIAAGYETTSAAMGWIVYLLGMHRGWQERARAEVTEVLDDRPPTPADLARLPLLRAVVDETLRLYPPAMISARYVTTGFEHDGREVRPGDLVIFSPYVTHRDPGLYPDPQRFRPDRWLEGGRRPPPEYLPFGGGQHRCIGSHLATTELVVMTARLLARGDFSVDRPPSRTRGFAAMRPHPGVGITLSPRAATQTSATPAGSPRESS